MIKYAVAAPPIALDVNSFFYNYGLDLIVFAICFADATGKSFKKRKNKYTWFDLLFLCVISGFAIWMILDQSENGQRLSSHIMIVSQFLIAKGGMMYDY